MPLKDIRSDTCKAGMTKEIRFITGASCFGQDIDAKSWYTNDAMQEVTDFIESPNLYQQGKNDKHTGIVFLFDKSFTSKYPSLQELARAANETAINGTLGIDPQGRPCIWLEHDRQVGEFRVHPSDQGTVCTNTKIVGIRAVPGSDPSWCHAFPIESTENYQLYMLVADLLKSEVST